MTPYAVLLVRPTDTDAVVRKVYHALARANHPDRDGANGVPGPLWTAVTEAYKHTATQERRDAWWREVSLLSAGCAACGGFGVRGSRVGGARIKACDACGGEGRVK